MSTSVPRALLQVRYYQAAQEYLRNLPLEHFMEATAQAHQREITLASMALVNASRPKIQYFNELLVQYAREGTRKPGQVVPDNMVVIHDHPIEAEGSYDVPLQPVPPFWVLEYVSKSNRRKDYEDSMRKYEHELKVPYYLLFVPEQQELTLYHHNRKKYVSVKPNVHGRYALPELELELILFDGWVRFWFRGELLPLPADLQQQLDLARRKLKQVERRAGRAEQEAQKERQTRLTAEQRARVAERRAEQEREARMAAEQELARLRGQVAGPQGPPASS